MGAHLGANRLLAEQGPALRQALGQRLADRVAALLRRWSQGAAADASFGPAGDRFSTRGGDDTGTARGAAPAAGGGAHAPEPEAGSCEEEEEPSGQSSSGVDAALRNKVVGVLMRASARGAGRAAFTQCREIEAQLFEVAGADPKGYKSRARSLAFNLGAADGALLQRVLSGEMKAAELVRLEGEDLASDTLKAKRREERDRYFRNEVQLAQGPVKRRRDLWRLPGQTAKEEDVGGVSDLPAGDAAEEQPEHGAGNARCPELDSEESDEGSESEGSTSEGSESGSSSSSDDGESSESEGQ